MSEKVLFKITKQSLEKIQSEGVPDDVLENLKALNNQELITEGKFLDSLKATIGEEQTVQYKSAILKHTRERMNKSLLNKLNSVPSWVVGLIGVIVGLLISTISFIFSVSGALEDKVRFAVWESQRQFEKDLSGIRVDLSNALIRIKDLEKNIEDMRKNGGGLDADKPKGK